MMSTDPQASTLAAFHAAPPAVPRRDVVALCASGSFPSTIVGGRPYPDQAALQDAVNAAFKALSWDDIVESMNAHPRIGDRVPGGGWSAGEQSGAASASETVRQAL